MWEFCVTVFMGFVGTVIDMLFFNMMGNFGVILAIATMGSFILSRMDRDDPDDPEPDDSDNDTDQI